MAKRKISFNFLTLRKGEEELDITDPLCNLLQYIGGKTKVERKKDLTQDKFAFLDHFDILKNHDGTKSITLLFKNAKHGYRAPLLNRNTVEARENPKSMEEGEQNKTHLLIKIKEEAALLFLETGNGLLTCKNIVDYLNMIIRDYNNQDIPQKDKIQGKFGFDMMPREDFEEVLQKMSRVVCAEVFVDKRILGQGMLGYTEPSEELKSEIVLTMKAEKKKNIERHIYNLLDKLNGARSEVKRIRVRGKMENGQESIIDTDFIIKKEYIDAVQDKDTGEYDTDSMFVQLKHLSKDY